MESRQNFNNTRLLVSLDQDLIDSLQEVILKAFTVLDKFDDREKQYRKELDANKLMDEQEACEYLRRGSATLHYYRTLGLPYFKKGKDVWFTKADIDNWMNTGKVNQHRR